MHKTIHQEGAKASTGMRLPTPLTTPVSPLTTSLPAAPSPPLSLVDVAGLAAFRMAVQHHSGCARPEPGFAGMIHELRDYQRTHSVTEQVECSSDIMATLAGPIPWLFKAICSRTPFGPAILAWFTCVFGPFLVGEMSLTPRAPDDMRSGGVRITRCKVLAESGCAGLCLNMCKLPTERMFAEKWGVPLYTQPHLETPKCTRTPYILRPTIHVPCYSLQVHAARL